ncbi:MAG: hypothetical protein B7Z72_14365, partial [Gemmatimonadetes bacterium 21-71-4]
SQGQPFGAGAGASAPRPQVSPRPERGGQRHAAPRTVERGAERGADRAAVPFEFLTPFYEGVSVSSGTRFSTWHRALGAEARLTMGRLSQAYLPGFDIRLGVARSLDAPFAARTTLYSTVRYTP